MDPTPSSTTPSSGGRSPEEHFRVRRKRNRVPLSCHPCRARKLKCDRNHPCGNCTKREGADASSCSYAAPASRKKNQSRGSSSPEDMQDRINRLEGLVLSLMHGAANLDTTISTTDAAIAAGSHVTGTPATDSGTSPGVVDKTDGMSFVNEERDDEDAQVDDDASDETDTLAASLGVLKVDSDKGKSLYVGQEHWHTILADISEVKNYFNSHKKELEKSYEKVMQSKPRSSLEGPTLLLGARPAPEDEIREGLPPKPSVFTLCSRYFNSADNAVAIIHSPTFQQQLKAHWREPGKTPIMWLGLLYAIMCLAMLSYHKAGDAPLEWKDQVLDMAAEYRLRTVQCLMMADYTKPVEYTIETMILYVFGEHMSRWDADLGLWLIVSMITRIAFRMGYHRDAKWFPSLTPFQAEMRRRNWAMVRMIDVIYSHQVSLPTMIYEHDCDTQLPNSIFDEEFGPDTKELPPSRPNSEPTPVAYIIAKSRLCFELGNILQATTRVSGQLPYDEVLRFDTRLQDMMQDLPPHLKLASLEGSQDPVTLILSRFNIDNLYQKILCLLHRKFLTKSGRSPRYSHSRRRAIEASLTMLGHLAVLHRESQPNGRLRSVRWHVNTIATKDFLLPTMLVMVDLHWENLTLASSSRRDDEPSFWTARQRLKMVNTVEETRDIWRGLADVSMEAYKASKIIEIMLQKIRSPIPNPPSAWDTGGLEQVGNAGETSGQGDLIPTDPTMTVLSPGYGDLAGILSGGLEDRANQTASASMSIPGPSSSLFGEMGTDPFGSMGPNSPFSMFTTLGSSDTAGNVDWDALESYTQSVNWGSDQTFQMFTGEPVQMAQDNGSAHGSSLSPEDEGREANRY